MWNEQCLLLLRLDKREKGLRPFGLWLPVPFQPPTMSWILGSRSVFDFGFLRLADCLGAVW